MYGPLSCEKKPNPKFLLGDKLASLVRIDDSFFRKSDRIPMDEAIRKANEAGVVMASNKTASKSHRNKTDRMLLERIGEFWTGTMAGFEAIDKKLGKMIEDVDEKNGVRYVFPVPEEHVGKTNVVLVVEHPGFTLEREGNTRIVRASKVDVVARVYDGDFEYHDADPKYDIPIGKKVLDGTKRSSRMLTKHSEAGVRLIYRDFGGSGHLDEGGLCDYKRWRGINFDTNLPDNSAGLVVEVDPALIRMILSHMDEWTFIDAFRHNAPFDKQRYLESRM